MFWPQSATPIVSWVITWYSITHCQTIPGHSTLPHAAQVPGPDKRALPATTSRLCAPWKQIRPRLTYGIVASHLTSPHRIALHRSRFVTMGTGTARLTPPVLAQDHGQLWICPLRSISLSREVFCYTIRCAISHERCLFRYSIAPTVASPQHQH